MVRLRLPAQILLLLLLLAQPRHAAADEAPTGGIPCHPDAAPPEVCPDGTPCPSCGSTTCSCPGPAPPPPPGCPFFAHDILMDFYDATGGADWKKNEGWGSVGERAPPCCEWFGVYCDDSSSSVVKLRLTENGLSGTLTDDL